LQQNWFSTAADLASMTETQAAALGVPLKLKSWIDHALAPETDNQEQQLETTSNVGGGIAIPPAAAALFHEQLSNSEVAVVDSNESSSGDTSDDYESSDEVDLAVGNTLSSTESSVPITAATAAPLTSLDKFIDQEGWEDLPIELRICPPLDRFGYDFKTRPNVVTRGRATKYALKLSEMPLPLQKEFEELHKFGTQKFFGAQADPIAPVTALKYQDHLRGMLGWLHTVCGIPIDQLSLKNLLPTSERKSVSLAFDYCQWMVNERGVNVRTELLALRSILFAAKFLYHEESKVTLNSGEKPYSDLGVVKELRTLINTANKASKVAPRVADEAAKWLDWPEYLQLVQELRKECALLLPHNPRSPEKLERSRQQVAWSLQRYLIFAILACVPDRQRTLRELEVGRTLFKEGDRWIIRHGPGDYKTGKSYGERPPMVLNPTVYPELEAYVNTWRQELASPEHQRLFTQRNGGIFSDKQLSKFFMTSAYRLTGKRLTPHLVRDSIVTFLRKSEGISERELEALALYMGHSIEMQRSSYDRRTKEEKVGPAVALLETINQLASKYTN
jgi:integrase